MVVSLCTVSMAAERMQCVPSEAVCIFLLMFWMAVFRTHQSQTGVPIAEECTVYLLNKLSSQLQVAEAPHCLTGVLTPLQDETFGISTFLRSRPGSTLFKSLIYLILCPGHLPSLARFVEAFPHLSSFRGWIALSQGELLSKSYCSVPFEINTSLCQACLLETYKPSLQSRRPPPFDLPQLSPHWLVDKSAR